MHYLKTSYTKSQIRYKIWLRATQSRYLWRERVSKLFHVMAEDSFPNCIETRVVFSLNFFKKQCQMTVSSTRLLSSEIRQTNESSLKGNPHVRAASWTWYWPQRLNHELWGVYHIQQTPVRSLPSTSFVLSGQCLGGTCRYATAAIAIPAIRMRAHSFH